MKKLIFLSLLLSFVFLNAQEFKKKDQISKSEKTFQGLNSKKETVIEKEIIHLGEFKDLTFQKIILKDLSDNSTVSNFGIMTFHETFNTISKRTITLEKDELNKLIESLLKIEQKSNSTPENEIKYKYVTQNGIEIGSSYHPISKTWGSYMDLSSQIRNYGIIKISSKELEELITLLKSIQKQL